MSTANTIKYNCIIVGSGLAGLMAARWPGFFEGAVRTGESAAAAISQLLKAI